MSSGLKNYIDLTFGVSEIVFQNALELSPGSQGSISGAISEILLKRHLEAEGFEVLRIKEKPSGGNDAKNDEARGDFYVRASDSTEDKWWVVESKGLKSNSEFRGGKLDSPEKVFNFLRSRLFDSKRTPASIYGAGLSRYHKAREAWEKVNKGKSFPDFSWSRVLPGPESFDLDGLWKSETDLKSWVYGIDKSRFTEDAYRACRGPISILETHKPSSRVGPLTGIKQAAPLVQDFSVLAVDLFFRTGRHEFAFVSATDISHSPTSPEHLYQNYMIDILVPGLKDRPRLRQPWFQTFSELLDSTFPKVQPLDHSQLDNRAS